MKQLLQKASQKLAKDKTWTTVYHYGEGVLFLVKRNYAAAVRTFEKSVAAAKATQDEAWLYKAMDLQAWALGRMNETDQALAIYQQIEDGLLQNADSRSDTTLLIYASFKLAYNEYEEDNYTDAVLQLQDVLEIAQLARDTFNQQRILYVIMDIQDYLDDDYGLRLIKDQLIALLEGQDNDYNKIQILTLKMEWAETEEDATYYFNELEEMNKEGKVARANEYLYSYATWLEEHVS